MTATEGAARTETWFMALVAEHQEALLRLCFAMLRDRALAEDAVQETFLKAYRSRGTYRGDSGEKTWLTSIAVNVCRDMRSSAWFRHTDRRVTPEMLPEPAAEVSPDQQEIALAVMALPGKLREAALLCWYQGMSEKEAARALRITQQAVSRRVERARRRLRLALEGGEQDDL